MIARLPQKFIDRAPLCFGINEEARHTRRGLHVVFAAFPIWTRTAIPMNLKRTLAPLALVLACAACPNPFESDSPPAELTRNLNVWRQQGITDYRYVLTASCECLPQWTRAAEVVVRDGQTLAVRYLENGSTDVWPRYRELDRVEELFDFVDDAYERDADVIDVEYHPQHGFPTRISVDYDRQVGDDELVIGVTGFMLIASNDQSVRQ